MFSFSGFFSALEQFDVISLFGPSVGGMNNVAFAVTLVAFIAIVLLTDARSSVNGRMSFVMYLIFSFIRQLLEENLQLKKNIFFYYTIALFGFIVTANILGLIPYSLTVTSYLAVTLFLSGMSFFGNMIIGFRLHSFRFFLFFVPAGAPEALLGMLVVIEVISYFSRLFSLAIRLFANMMAGHALLKILSGFVYLFLESGIGYFILPLILNCVVLAVTALEVMIAFLQAYVFVVLSTIYTNEAINLH